MTVEPPQTLTCIECDKTSEDGVGWRAEIGVDIDNEEPDEVAVFCSECWEREFG